MLCYAKALQSCPTLCDPIDGSPPGSLVPGILQARTLMWVVLSFSNAWKGKVKVKSLSCVQPLATPWTAAHQAPPSMGFSRQENWSRVPLPSPSSGTMPTQMHWSELRCEWALLEVNSCSYLELRKQSFPFSLLLMEEWSDPSVSVSHCWESENVGLYKCQICWYVVSVKT